MDMKPHDPPGKNEGPSALLILSILLIGLGAIVLVGNLDIIPYAEWHRYWPVALILMGILELARFHRARN